MIISNFRIAIVAIILFSVLTGLFYPLVVTGIAQLVFPHQANGSMLKNNDGRLQGSELIGQPFSNPKYFWGRMSATSPFPYNAGSSAASNLGPTNQALIDVVKNRIRNLKYSDPKNIQSVPADLVTASGSGLDPHISVAGAMYQVHRVARTRGLSDDQVQSLVSRYTEGRQLGFLGEPRVNVLRLNLALDQTKSFEKEK